MNDWTLTQIAPIIANAGLTQTISYTDNSALQPAALSAFTSTNPPSPSTFNNSKFGPFTLAQWLFIAALGYLLLK